MVSLEFDKYEVKEIVQEQDNRFDSIVEHLSGILNDQSVPENQKQSARKQFDEIIKLKMLSMKSTKITLKKTD